MFESLREWCNFPVNIKHRTGTGGDGTAVYAEAVAYCGYPVQEVKNIVDKTGKEVISSSRVYLPAEVPVTEQDLIAIGDDVFCEIRKVGGFYAGRNTVLDIWVVYL